MSSVNIIMRRTQSPEKIKALRTDNGGEYLSASFQDYLADHGIAHQLTIAYTPQQNGVAERMNRTVINLVRSMLHSADLDKRFWAEALSTAVYIRNRVPSRSLPKDETPYTLWFGSIPDLSHLRIFGSKCWYMIPKTKLRKLDSRAREALLIGYATQSKGYKLWDIELMKPIISRDVKFNEVVAARPELSPFISVDTETDVHDQGREAVTNDLDISHDEKQGEESDSDEFEECGIQDDNQGESEPDPTPPPLRRSTRKFTKPKEWWKTTSTAFTARTFPSSYKAATSPDNIDFWSPGIEREHDCLLRNKTWELVKRKDGMHVLPSKYVFRVKNGKPKARLVVLGCRQVYGLDYSQTFAPVVKMSTIRLVLALVAARDLECEQMDVVTAFLNGDLDEDIYMEIPQELKTTKNSDQVCKLRKAVYGLKQAPRQWYAKIHEYLVRDLGFTSSLNDPCLYTQHQSSSLTIIALYVDDLLVAGNDKEKIRKLKSDLSEIFEMKDLGPLSVMLGIKISRDRVKKLVFISQPEYTREILSRFGMENLNPLSTPMLRSEKFSGSQESSSIDVPYREAIGSLMYLMICTRPDIAYAVGKLAQHSQYPQMENWIAVKRVFRYLKGTTDFGILYNGTIEPKIFGFSDSDYA